MDEGCVEAGDSFDATVQESEVYIYSAPGTGTDHDATFAGVRVEQLLGSCLAAALGFVQVGTHIGGLTLVTTEEFGNRGRYRRQHTAIGQLVANAEVGIGTDIDLDNGTIIFQELEETTLVLGGFANIEMPFRRIVCCTVLDPCNLELKGNLCLQGFTLLLLLFFLLFSGKLGLVFVRGFTVFVLLVVARDTVETRFGVQYPLIELIRIQTCLEFVHLVLQGLEGRVGLGDLLEECLGICPSLHGKVHAEVSVQRFACIVFLILIDKRAIGLDESTHCLQITIEHEGGEAVVRRVIDNKHVEVGIHSLLACRRRYAEAEGNTDHSILRLRGAVELLGTLGGPAVEEEASGDTVDDDRVEAQGGRFQISHEVAPRIVCVIVVILGLLVLVVAALAVEVEEAGDADVEGAAIALVGFFAGLEFAFQMDGCEVQVERELLELHIAIVDGPVLDVALCIHLGRDDNGSAYVNLVFHKTHGATQFKRDLAIGVVGGELVQIEAEGTKIFLCRSQRPFAEVKVEGLLCGANVHLFTLHEDFQGSLMNLIFLILACFPFVLYTLIIRCPFVALHIGEAHLGKVNVGNLQLQGQRRSLIFKPFVGVIHKSDANLATQTEFHLSVDFVLDLLIVVGFYEEVGLQRVELGRGYKETEIELLHLLRQEDIGVA